MSTIKCSVLAAILVLTGLWALYPVQAAQQPGTWVNITPANMKMSGDFINGPIGASVDPVNPSCIYVQVQYDGCWKSTDFGQTWVKVSTGRNAGSMNSGRQWYVASDMNPHRDPSTPMTLYTTMGYGAGGIWKSTNNGVDWDQVWSNNIYKEDGVTNISSDLGNDLSGVMAVDSSEPDHLIAFLHGYWGTGNNNGVFESTDGGKKWIVHVSSSFAFQAHGDVVSPFNATTWIVSHGSSWPNSVLFRTTNGGIGWSQVPGTFSGGSFGRAYCIVGSTMYVGSDFTGGILKSTDQGETWTNLYGGSGQSKISWVVATATKVYMSDAQGDAPHIRHALLANDKVWIDDGNPSGMSAGGSRGVTTFDGNNFVIIACQETGGLWRYVEPAAGTGAKALESTRKIISNRPGTKIIMSYGQNVVSHYAKDGVAPIFYDVKGKRIGSNMRKGD